MWKAAHPNTAEDLEKNNERIRSMQEQISATYEQIRSEQAQQLHLQSQILQRTSGKTDATNSRAETMLESALKQARADVIFAATAYDGTDGTAVEFAEGERPGVGGSAMIEADAAGDAPARPRTKYVE